jgi:predicted nucleotidyltransferase
VTQSNVEQRLRGFFETGAPDAVAVYLYGSEARGTSTPESDIDLAILYARPPERTLDALPLAIESELERRVGRPVQIVVLNEAPADLVHRILRDGRLLLDRDRAARIRFEVRARNDFFDLAPIRQRYRQPVVRAGRV